MAVGLTHAHRGNARGAVALLRRGARRVREYQAGTPPEDAGAPAADRGHPYGMDVAEFLAVADGLAARIERRGLPGIPAADLSPRLLMVREADP